MGIGAGSVAASQAGGPLYGPRMWIEAATLPSDPMARANAQFARLDARLQEVRVASGSGNAGAAEAALEAYAVIVADLDAQAATNSAVAASVEDDMARRQVVLIGLLDEVPAQAQDAIQHALQQGANAIDGAGVDPHPGDPARPGAGGQGGGQGGQGGKGWQSGSGPGHRPGRAPARAPGHGPDRTTPDPTPDRRTDAGPDAEAHEAAQGAGGRSHAGARSRQRQPTPGGGNQNKNGGSSRQSESGGGQAARAARATTRATTDPSPPVRGGETRRIVAQVPLTHARPL